MSKVDNKAAPGTMGPRRERFEEWRDRQFNIPMTDERIKSLLTVAYKIGRVDGQASLMGSLSGLVSSWKAAQAGAKIVWQDSSPEED